MRICLFEFSVAHWYSISWEYGECMVVCVSISFRYNHWSCCSMLSWLGLICTFWGIVWLIMRL